tara:strand:+ start:109 stop:612 length:504 start_codon:yes stop_codon:yes gene_type:complete
VELWLLFIGGCFIFGFVATLANPNKHPVEPTSYKCNSFLEGSLRSILYEEPDDYLESVDVAISDWDQICLAAVEKAKSGDSGARTWVTKYVYEKREVPKPPKVDKPPSVVDKETPSLTSTKVIEDAVMFLCCLGEKKRKVEHIVKDLGTKKKYEKVEDLVKDFYKHS